MSTIELDRTSVRRIPRPGDIFQDEDGDLCLQMADGWFYLTVYRRVTSLDEDRARTILNHEPPGFPFTIVARIIP